MTSCSAIVDLPWRGNPFPARFVMPLFLGSALNPINSSVLATALVPIGRGLGISVGRTAVLVTVLYVASSIAQPTAGRLAEHFGPRRVFLIGIAIVFAAGVIGGTAHSLAALVVARILLGVGTSGGNPSSMVQVRRRAGLAGLEEPPGWVFAGIGGASEVGLVVGLPLGALLVSVAGWRAAFWLDVPLALVALTAALCFLPADPPRDRVALKRLADELDVIGMATFGSATVLILVFLLALPSTNWPGLAVSVTLWIAFVMWERRARIPFIDVRLLAANRALSRTYVRTALMLFVTYAVLYGFTEWLQTAGGYSAAQAGLLVLPMAAVGAIAAVPIGRRRLGVALLVAAPVSALVGSLALFAVAGAHSPLWIVAVTVLFGVTEASAYVGSQRLIAAQASAARAGTAMGLFGTAIYSGAIASSAMTNVLFHHSVTDGGLRWVAAILVGCSLIALAMALADSRLMRRHGTQAIAPTRHGADNDR